MDIERYVMNDICCICLDVDDKMKILNCCHNSIHIECLFLIFLEKIYQCPLCRAFINPKDYFTTKSYRSIMLSTKVDSEKSDVFLWKISDNTCVYYYNKMLIFNSNKKNKKYILLIVSIVIFWLLFCIFFIITVDYPYLNKRLI